MLFTIGDVLAFLAALIGTSLAVWAMGLGAGLLFYEASERSARTLERRFGATVWTGLGALVPILFVVTVLAAIPNPVTRALSLVVGLAVLGLASVGLAGMGRLVGERVMASNPATNALAARGKGLAIVLAACLVPLVGWMVVLPVVLISAMGTTVMAWRDGRREKSWNESTGTN